MNGTQHLLNRWWLPLIAKVMNRSRPVALSLPARRVAVELNRWHAQDGRQVRQSSVHANRHLSTRDQAKGVSNRKEFGTIALDPESDWWPDIFLASWMLISFS